MITEDTEIVTIIIGEEGKAKEAAKIEEAIVELHPEIEVEIHQGDQPVYPYLSQQNKQIRRRAKIVDDFWLRLFYECRNLCNK